MLTPKTSGYGFVGLKENPIFETDFIRFQRDVDTEAKILEEVAYRLGNNSSATGNIVLYTERSPCFSCQRVILQFQQRYPNIKVNVFYSKPYSSF